ncbi:hypothetical protein [Methanobrevibacter olleyae]|uniref:Phage-related protein n=1 Tax=Methanobrevibacter olleyae TaxID=294671 RepID=A0A126R2N1_METOL|nr:hypothetical protein [Methanobrevibacter olleyae]AMK16332.1 phage-related protein [Methanobrevibacter olleyae]
MSYDNNSFYGDMIVDEYDDKNNFMNPETSVGFFMYKVLGEGFDLMSEFCNQFLNDLNVLSCDSKKLDLYWGVSYNLPRPKIHHANHVYSLFEDKGVLSDYNTNYTQLVGNVIKTVMENKTKLAGGSEGSNILKVGDTFTSDFQVDLDYFQGDWRNRQEFRIINENNKVYRIMVYPQNPPPNSIVLTLIDGDHVTIKKIGDTLTVYVNNVEKGSIIIDGSEFTFAFSLFTTTPYFYYKNLIIQDLSEDAVNYLTDTEYRIYLYLKNCRLITLEDILINFNKCFQFDNYKVFISNETHYLQVVDHNHYVPAESVSSNIGKNGTDTGKHFVTNHATDGDTEVFQGLLSTVEETETVINVPFNNWDSGFLSFLETFISVKGNIRLKEYDL